MKTAKLALKVTEKGPERWYCFLSDELTGEAFDVDDDVRAIVREAVAEATANPTMRRPIQIGGWIVGCEHSRGACVECRWASDCVNSQCADREEIPL